MYPFRIIHVQQANRRTAFWCVGMNVAIRGQLKMICPALGARMKEANEFLSLRIKRGDIRPFVPITMETRICQILRLSVPTMLLGQYVIDLMAMWVQFSVVRFLAVFALMTSPLNDQRAQLPGNVGCHYVEALRVRSARAFSIESTLSM